MYKAGLHDVYILIHMTTMMLMRFEKQNLGLELSSSFSNKL